MLQQVIAILVILFFLIRLIYQRIKGQILFLEFLAWLFFWLIAALAVIFLKQIDAFVLSLGFSGSGIDIMLYLGFVFLIYLVFKLRIKLEKMERNITQLVREIALKNNNK